MVKKTERGAQGAQGLHTHCTEIMSRLSRLNRGLKKNRYHPSSLGKANARMIGLYFAGFFNIKMHTHHLRPHTKT